MRERMGKSDMQPRSAASGRSAAELRRRACGCAVELGVAALALLRDRCVSDVCAAAAEAEFYARVRKINAGWASGQQGTRRAVPFAEQSEWQPSRARAAALLLQKPIRPSGCGRARELVSRRAVGRSGIKEIAIKDDNKKVRVSVPVRLLVIRSKAPSRIFGSRWTRA